MIAVGPGSICEQYDCHFAFAVDPDRCAGKSQVAHGAIAKECGLPRMTGLACPSPGRAMCLRVSFAGGRNFDCLTAEQLCAEELQPGFAGGRVLRGWRVIEQELPGRAGVLALLCPESYKS